MKLCDLEKLQEKWNNINIQHFCTIQDTVDDSLGVINVELVRKIYKHEYRLLSDVLDSIVKKDISYDYVNFEHQNIYAAGCKVICQTFLNAKWGPKILNLSNNKILYDIFDCPEMSGFLNLETTIWINLCGNYCMCDKKDILKIDPKWLIKIIFIQEDDLDKDDWRYNFREKTDDGIWLILHQNLETAILESHKKYYKTIKTILHYPKRQEP